MKVLIADDSQLMRERIRESVSIFGSVEIVSETSGGWQTLEDLKKYKPDLAIIDISMPDLNGLEILKEFLPYNVNKETRIIVLTNYAYEQYRDKAFMYGASYFLSKTDDFDQIPAILGRKLHTGKKKILPF